MKLSKEIIRQKSKKSKEIIELFSKKSKEKQHLKYHKINYFCIFKINKNACLMCSTVIYIVLLLIGIVGYAYFLYVEIRNNKLREEGKEIRKKLDLIAVFSALMVLPVMHLTEKWLSLYITSEIAMFFFQIFVLMVLLLAIGIPVRRIAKR